MPRRRLKEALQELHSHLEHGAPIDEGDRSLLRQTVQDIEAVLEHPSETVTVDHPHLVEGLRDSVQKFEVSHPTLANIVGRLIDILAQAGI